MAADPARWRELTGWFYSGRGLIKNKPPPLVSHALIEVYKTSKISLLRFSPCAPVVVKMTGVRHNYIQGDFEKFFACL